VNFISEIWKYEMKRNDVNLYFRGDIHLGCKQADVAAWQETNAIVAEDPLGFDFIMGDVVDSIVAKDKRYDPFNRDPQFESVDDAFSFFEEEYTPLKDKSGGMIIGNHEWKLIQYCEMNEIKKICRRLKIPYLGYAAFLELVFPNGKTLTGFIAHGTGGGRRVGAKMNKLDEVKGKISYVNFAVYGHSHELWGRPVPVLDVENHEVIAKNIHTASSGSFLRNYVEGTTGYGERGLYDPLPVGYVYLEVRDGEISEGFHYNVFD
jgi:hypothetical protein